MRRMIHFGAGNIGRGLIAPIMQASEYKMTFVDVNKEVIDRLNSHKDYEVTYWDNTQASKINNYDAEFDTNNESFIEKFRNTELVTTAVTPKGLEGVARILSNALDKRKSVNKKLVIMACENMEYATDYLRNLIMSFSSEDVKKYITDYVIFLNTAIDRNIPNQNSEDGLSLNVEKYHEFVIESEEENFLNLEGATIVKDLTPYIERKLFIVNNAHATTGYYAFYNGYRDMEAAFKDGEVKKFLKGVMNETKRLLINKFPEEKENLELYCEKTYKRFVEDFKSDSITRVCRNPKQKLSYNERIVRPTRQYLDSFLELPDQLVWSIVMGLYYNNEEDTESNFIQELVKNKGIESAITEITGIEQYSKLYKQILKYYNNIGELNIV